MYANIQDISNIRQEGGKMTVVGYCRLSRDEDKENYASIEEQKRIIKDYANTRNWIIEDKDFYIDDNVSGYTFNRPEFLKMIEGVKGGKIDVVISKDLSRIGRNNGRVLVLIDEFKNMQKNLILVSEMGGTYDVLNDRDDTIGITTWFNERYVKDCSRKTRDHMYSKQKTGRLIMGNYYGYIKDKEDVTKLYVDEEIRPIIELIYKLYIEEGLGRKKICDILNNKYDYPTPSVYYQRKHLERGRIYKHPVQKLWSTYMISNILSNDVYCGNLRTHKKKTVSIRGRAIKLPKEEHFVFENHHEAIISKETFKLVQKIKERKAKTKSTSGTRKRNYYFSGLCRCGDCGFGISGITITRKQGQKGYECSQYRTYGKARCKCHEIKENDMIIHLKEFLKFTKQKYIEQIEKIEIDTKINKEQVNKEKIKFELETLMAEYKVLLNQKVKDLTSSTNEYQKQMIENTYRELEIDKTNQIEKLQQILKKEEQEISKEKIKKLKTAIEYFDDIIESEMPSRYVLENIIDTIWIYSDKTLKIDLKVDIEKLV
jgi:site-specific DNA recombinase